MDGNVHGGNIEGLEHDLGHLFSVDLGVKRGLSQENWVLIWGDSKLYVESVVPDLLHIIPVLDDTVLNWVRDLENTSLLLSLVSEILVLALNTDENVEVLGSSDDGGEDASGGIFTRETGLDDTGAVIDNENLIVFCHLDFEVGILLEIIYYNTGISF